MILDILPNLAHYAPLSTGLSAAAAFLAENDLTALAPGRHPIDGDDVFANVQDYFTHAPDPERFEMHREYVDLQLVVSGSERVGLTRRTPCLPEVKPYDAGTDLEWVRSDGELWLPLPAAHFLVIFPHEAHQPGCHPGDAPVAVRKIIVKMRVE